MINLAQCRVILDKMAPDYLFPYEEAAGKAGTMMAFGLNRQDYAEEYTWLCGVVLQDNNEKES